MIRLGLSVALASPLAWAWQTPAKAEPHETRRERREERKAEREERRTERWQRREDRRAEREERRAERRLRREARGEDERASEQAPATNSVPELNPVSAATAVLIVAGAVSIIFDRRRSQI